MRTVHLETAAAEEPIDFPPGADSRGVSRRRGGVTVKIEQWQTDADSQDRSLTVRATVAYDSGGPAFESHRSWMLYNVAGLVRPVAATNPDANVVNASEAELLKPTDSQSELQPNGSIGVTYRFVNLPRGAGEYSFRYVAPTLILDVPVEFEWRNVALPAR